MAAQSVDNRPQTIMQMMTGFWISQSLYVAAKLNISDHLETGPLTIDLLAEKTHSHKDYLYRVMRALASIGFYSEVQDSVFALTPSAELLCSNKPDSMRSVIIMLGEENYTSWAKLYDAICSGLPPFQLAYGTNAYDYFAKNPASGEVFNAAMAALVRNVHAAIVEAYDFSEFTKIVDIGGGNGMLLVKILQQSPNAFGILFELPQVLEDAQKLLQTSQLEERCDLIAGDFFESVVKGGDAYILSHIMHTFNDESCRQILKNVYKAMPPSGKLLIIEDLLEPGDTPSSAKTKFMDINMLVFTPGGREHTREEFNELLEESGFKLTQVIATESGAHILEAVKQK